MPHPSTESTPRIRIILPVHRDRDAVLQTLSRLLTQGWRREELLVVTADEPDTRDAVREQGVKVINLGADLRGRAHQMNAGARETNVDLLVFLHADTRLPPDARDQLARAYLGGAVGGGFRRRFDSPSLFLKLTCRLAALRGKASGW